jgi:uncharacterized protein (TIRG00374 family)
MEVINRLKNYKQLFQALRTFIGIGVSVFLLWLLLKQSNTTWQSLTLSGTGLLYMLAAMAVFIATVYLQSKRVKLLWLPNKNVDTYASLLCGNFYNCVLPGNLGEAVRVMHMSRKNRLPVLRSLASQIVEKYVDAVSFSVLVFIWIVIHGVNTIIDRVFIGVSIVCAAAFLFSILLFIKRGIVKWIIKWLPGSGGLFKIWLHFKNFLVCAANNKTLINYVLAGFVFFGLNMLQYYLVMRAVGLTPPVSFFWSNYYLALAMVIIMFLPSAPGNLGIAHYGIYFCLITLNTGIETGIEHSPQLLQQYAQFAIYHHLSFFVPELLLGFVWILKERKYLF